MFIHKKKKPSEITTNLELILNDSGKTKAILSAPLVHNYSFETKDSNYREFPNGVRLLTYNSEQVVESELIANYGILRERVMIVRDSVVINNFTEQQSLFTDELIRHLDSAKIYTDKDVKIMTKNGPLYGHGLVADDKFSWYEITNFSGVYDVIEK